MQKSYSVLQRFAVSYKWQCNFQLLLNRISWKILHVKVGFWLLSIFEFGMCSQRCDFWCLSASVEYHHHLGKYAIRIEISVRQDGGGSTIGSALFSPKIAPQKKTHAPKHIYRKSTIFLTKTAPTCKFFLHN